MKRGSDIKNGAKRAGIPMNEQKNFLLQALIMAAACAIALAVMTVMLYRHDIKEHRDLLQVTVQSQARLIEVIARHEAEMMPEGEPGQDPFTATLGHIIDSHDRYEGFSETGEFTLARRDGDSIVFVMRHRHAMVEAPAPAPFDSDLAVPMRRALEGLSGTLIGPDYRGKTVLAAYEPIAALNMGLVAKIDLSEIRAPFIRSGLSAAAVGLLVVLAGALLFIRVSNPLIVRVEHARELEREIIEREEAEETLGQSEERFRTLVEQAGDAFFLIDSDTAKLLDVNRRACELLHYTRDELLTLTVPDIGPPEQAGRFRESNENLRVGEPQTMEAFHKRRDGTIFPVEIRSSLVEIRGKKRILALARDITERKLAEEAHKDLEAQLHQAQKMEAVGQLAGGVAHDFNNLLVAIVGYSQFALDDSQPGSSVHGALEEVLKTTDRATTLVRQLLAFSRKQILVPENIDLGEVVSDLAKMIQRVIGEHIAFNINSEPGLKSVFADKGQIEQILMNLCVNARDAMPGGGRLSIETSNTELDEEFCEVNTWARPGHYVVLSVSDTGCGMDDETQLRIFEPFFTTKEPDKGTGLGLSTVFGIVRQHNGMIHVYSEVGTGTTMRIYLARVEGAVNTQMEIKYGPPPGGTETILLADDDAGVRGVAEIMLRKSGYTVLTVSDGEEAIRALDEYVEKVDLALLDVVMPKLGGKAAFEVIREIHPETRALFVTGHSADGLEGGLAPDEGERIIQKPYRRDVLLRVIREVLDDD